MTKPPQSSSEPMADAPRAQPDEQPLRIQRVGMNRLSLIRRLNTAVFDEERIINTFDRDDLLMLVAWSGGEAAGFKIGYRFKAKTYYSAKGGVLPAYRRRGIARALLHTMMDQARAWRYETFLFDTFPNKHPGMTVLGLSEGFRVVKAGYSPQYNDYRLRFQKEL